MNPYTVLYLNLGSQANSQIQGHYSTEEQAKQYAEQLVAQQRSNLQTKQYFAVTIVNTKTGKLVGSVIDAPPAVNWTAE